MFVVQISAAFQVFVQTTDVNGFLAEYYHSGHEEVYGVLRWSQLSSKQWLAGDAKCEVDWVKINPNIGAEYCGTLYMVLTGQQVRVGDVSVKSFITDLFALSGAIFLLIV
ncbi:hypothetical protein AAVH_34948, partial [Aphelenchoides avenae]